ncbi:MAG: class I SAM-dependent methyltransferase [Propionibacteriaceae bacterium]|nr:class I SAM-dependent methyltransferase [Propionibacteriaceae bacterium]
MASVSMIPRAALEWLVGVERSSILLMGAAGGYPLTLVRAGHAVTVVDTDAALLKAVAARHVMLHTVVAKGESLPFDPCCFSTVLSIQNFHEYSTAQALGAWARVLRPHGRIGVAYVTRDDSVPWVKKLRRIVQSRLPGAMINDYGVESVAALQGSTYFPRPQQMTFRMWVPSTRAQLQDSARRAAGAEDLEEDQITQMLEEVGQLYDEYARPPDPLMLPYQMQCWRAEVDQATLTTTLRRRDSGLSISL